MSAEADLPLISVVFVSYNRAHTLVAAFETFLAFTDYPRERLELVLADDASDGHTQAILAQMPFDKRVIAPHNAGLGANQNRGMAAASGDYLLMLQDDWMLVGRGDYLKVGVRALAENADIGMVLYRDRPNLPAEIRMVGADRMALLGARAVNPASVSTSDFPYSDNPHLKRREFHEVVGLYREGVPMTRMELDMSLKVVSQSRFKVATIEGLEVFRHIGDKFSFNPSVKQAERRARMEKLPGAKAAIGIARRIVHRFRQR